MNLPKTLILDVTAEDIASGTKHDCAACPLARAAARSLVGFASRVGYGIREGIAAVFIQRQWLPGYHLGSYPLSRRARQFMMAFDNGEPVQPARFRLRLKEAE